MNYNIEPGIKSLLTPKSPKGDFFKLLIFSSSPLGAGVEMVKICSLKAFYTTLNIENQHSQTNNCSIINN
ncbi:MAG: hypothetical protein PWQ17_763 [Anaerophaga sp.]|nr:hypothetical protein [Anaerophaga sp.]MDK2841258.1 hypothetical protein [Anaerophaga sp.]MDN5290682.1 hypothetical protein [Anaerophaga sp.]